MIRHPLHRLDKKNRNIVTGILVSVASICLIVIYLDVPMMTMARLMLASAGLVALIILGAILFVALLKLPGKFLSRKSPDQEAGDSVRERE